MAKTKLGTVDKFKPKTKKKGSAFKQSGPKDKAVSKYRGQGR
jgi:hypothetical protein